MKETMHFEIVINTPVQKVWNTMLELETYKEWTSVFEPTSYYEGSWDKGSKIKFLGSGGSGMVSEIAENVPYEFVSIKHLGEMKNGVEDTTSEAVKKWLPAFENYTFTDKGVETLLAIDMEMESSPESQAMKEMFEGMWPKALLKLKEICER
ncbi:MAG: SRPBCC domain-containing protein [Candidatus Vogelbacteria bacterium]|nr:SRPBCC domain-containing protein [Candidatus Vogelbacteria bacterium]